MESIVWLVTTVLQLYVWVLVAGAVLSWLIAFGVVNVRNRAVAMIEAFCQRVTEPVLQPIRRFLPNLGGIDISPMVLILGIMFLQRLLYELLG
jgi:YggT family protein